MAPVEPVAASIEVEVALSTGPRSVTLVALTLPSGSTALAALRASGLAQGLPADQLDALQLSLGGKRCAPGHVLVDHDRVELLRPLIVDPKEARRQRYQRDGLKRAPRPTRPQRRRAAAP